VELAVQVRPHFLWRKSGSGDLHWRCATCCILPLQELPSWAVDLLLGSRALQKNAPDFRKTSPKSAGRGKILYIVWELILRHRILEDVYQSLLLRSFEGSMSTNRELEQKSTYWTWGGKTPMVGSPRQTKVHLETNEPTGSHCGEIFAVQH
jgi:hypothetical protein